MVLEKYSDLIRNLPYLDQAFETKKSTWLRECKVSNEFKEFCKKKFQNNTIKISRRDLFAECDNNFREAIFLIIFWGYPRNMRGNILKSILNSLTQIERILLEKKELTKEDFITICKKIKGTSMGMSTLTKILYFFQFKVEGYQCLILDSRIMDVLKEGMYLELSALRKISEYNKNEYYVEYLKEMDKISKAESYKLDQLEFFLFHFGKNLKSEN